MDVAKQQRRIAVGVSLFFGVTSRASQLVWVKSAGYTLSSRTHQSFKPWGKNGRCTNQQTNRITEYEAWPCLWTWILSENLGEPDFPTKTRSQIKTGVSPPWNVSLSPTNPINHGNKSLFNLHEPAIGQNPSGHGSVKPVWYPMKPGVIHNWPAINWKCPEEQPQIIYLDLKFKFHLWGFNHLESKFCMSAMSLRHGSSVLMTSPYPKMALGVKISETPA